MSAASKTAKKEAAPYYRENYQHLADELCKLDLLLQRRAIRFRRQNFRTGQAPTEGGLASQKIYITHEEVDSLLRPGREAASGQEAVVEIDRQLSALQQEINRKVAHSLKEGIFLALPELGHIFGLSVFEMQVILICLAPELHRKYDHVYAYLQDDLTRKKPSVDLALDLLCDTPAERWKNSVFFSDPAPLFRTGILQPVDDPLSPSGSSGLARFLKLDSRIIQFFLGNNFPDSRLSAFTEFYRPARGIQQAAVEEVVKTKIGHLIRHHFSGQNTNRNKLVLYLRGPYGIGKEETAAGICRELGCALLTLDMELLLNQGPDWEEKLRLAFREGLLLRAALYIRQADLLLEERHGAALKALAKINREYGWLTLLSGEKSWPENAIFEGALFLSIELPFPDTRLREKIWEETLRHLPKGDKPSLAGQLARRFRLTPGQIRDAANHAAINYAMNGPAGEITFADLCAACRSQSNQKLAELALKIKPGYTWEDLVLPEEKIARLKEICSQVRFRYRVFAEWGFERKLSHGKGLSALFAGPPGTGKTMAAEVMANELQLDLYKIDLSAVVSKYIGETEKNLSKIFHEAETGNAILFFDEADALFGKRTEVSDARDRYANIEISYLLQKMEEYEGMVILASNLRENMDEAFVRRLRFIVEFPFPGQTERLQIWETHFPREAPLEDGIDFEFLSRQFQIAGGNIKNIVLNSAFLAAENGGIIGMEHLLAGIKREFEKIGKLWNESQFAKSNRLE